MHYQQGECNYIIVLVKAINLTCVKTLSDGCGINKVTSTQTAGYMLIDIT